MPVCCCHLTACCRSVSIRDGGATVTSPASAANVHREIIQKGPPADAPFAYRPGQDPLPDGPLAGLIGDGGKKARLHIKTANNKLIIHYPNTSQELSLSTVQRVSSEPIPGREEYHIVGFKVGRRTTLFLYWVPAQYISAIKGAVLGYGV